MARKLFEKQGIRRRNGQLASGVTFVVYSDVAGTALADISATSGGSAIAGSEITTEDIAGLGPAAFRFYGPPSGTDTLYLRCPADTSLGVQEIEADEDERLDALEAGGGGGMAATIFDAKGDLLAASAADTAARLAAGSNGKVLAADSTQTAGLKWIVNEGPLWLTDPRVNAAGGGADDTVAVQAGLTLTDNTGVLGIPPGQWLVGNLTYRNQNLQGAGRNTSVLKSKPGQDILRSDQTLGPFDRQRHFMSDLKFIVDDSVDASGSLGRGGVGNAALAYPMTSGASQKMQILQCLWDNVHITSASQTLYGLNASCGVYAQAPVHTARFRALEIDRLVSGWYSDEPDTNLASSDYACDHNLWHGVRIDGCGLGMRLVNFRNSDMSDVVITQTHTGMQTVNMTSSLAIECSNFTMDDIYIESATTTPIVLLGKGHNIGDMVIQGEHDTVTLACSGSYVRRILISTLTGTNTPPVLAVTGHRNDIGLALLGNTGGTYDRDLVNDTGRGNRVTVHEYWGGQQFNTPMQVNRDGRTLHERDTASILLGHTSTPFVSGRDLLVNPLNILPGGLVEGTDFSWNADTAADLGHSLRILVTAATFSVAAFYAQQVNGPNDHSFKVGHTLPAAKVRVYVKAKLATGGTQTWTLHKVTGAVDLGNASLSFTTSYTVQSFDADATGLTVGDALQLTAGGVGGGGAGPVDIAWVAFRPYPADVLLASPITFDEISAPAAPASNKGLLYMRDNGSGKTQIVARFPTGAVQVIATEP